MKIRFMALLGCICFAYSLFAQRERYNSQLDCPSYNKILQDDNFARRNSNIKSISSIGRIQFDRVNGGGGNDINELQEMIGLHRDYSFRLVKETKSRLRTGKKFHTYQQYYRGVEVENARIILTGDDDSCEHDEAQIQISTDIDFDIPDVNPCFDSNRLGRIVRTSPSLRSESSLRIINFKLVIASNLKNKCNYHLTWKVQTTSRVGRVTIWVDACDGKILREANTDLNANYLPVSAKKKLTPQLELVDPTADILIYDDGDCIDDFEEEDIVCPVESDGFALQVSNIVQLIIDAFTTLEIDLGQIHLDIGCQGLEGVGVFIPDFSNDTNQFLAIDPDEMSCNLLAHEMGHAIVNNLIGFTGDIQNASVHEGLADIFAMYAESFCQDEIDWTLDIPSGTARDLTESQCFDDLSNEGPHTRGQVLGHWFYSQVVGEGMDMETAINLVLDILANFPPNGDVDDFIIAAVDMADSGFGYCSDESAAIRNAAQAVCIDMEDGVASCDYVIEANTSEGQVDGIGQTLIVCEEDDELTLFGGSEANDGHNYWYIPADWTLDTENGPTTGLGGYNTQQNYITFSDFPDYPYYPQYFEICLYSPEVGGNKGCIEIKLIDCDGDDPTCEEYHGSGLYNDSAAEIETRSYSFIQPSSMKVYNLSGQLIYAGNEYPLEELFENTFKQVLICVYFDNKGSILRTQKVFH